MTNSFFTMGPFLYHVEKLIHTVESGLFKVAVHACGPRLKLTLTSLR